jgi:Tfp pilus assembly pilus retraction ATPase PilT
MELRDLVAFAIKSRATELHLAPDSPVELLVAGKVKGVNLPHLLAQDIEEMVVQKLGAMARESLRTSGQCEGSIEVEGLGEFQALVEAGKARIILPVTVSPAKPSLQSADSHRSPGAVPTFAERLRGLFGGKQ